MTLVSCRYTYVVVMDNTSLNNLINTAKPIVKCISVQTKHDLKSMNRVEKLAESL